MTRPHPAVGIDLGTTYSAVAYLDSAGRPETIRNSEGGLTTPSAVFFDRSNAIVGLEAMEAGLHEPERLALFAKRDVGELQYRKPVRGETFPPEVIQALVLGKLKADAELKLGRIEKAVVTVPAFFNEPCRKATQDAGWLAGLEVLDIINEPTAAAICFGVEQGFLSPQGESEKGERVLVYDLGGGTFDVTLMEIKNRNYHTIATSGDVYLGGLDWDRRIVDFLAEAFIEQHAVDPREDPAGEQELLRKANQGKHSLTQRESVSMQFAHNGMRIRQDLDQATFKRLSEDLLERTLVTTQLLLDDAAMKWTDLTRLILVGGSTRMPMIRDELTKLSGLELDRSLSPDEAVSHGAAIYAGILLGHDADSFSGVSVTNVNSHDLGVLAVDPGTGDPRRQVMIGRNTRLPARKSIRFRTHEDNQANVKVQVVEGGDDKGNNATTIGKCLIDHLPAETPKGTFVDVQFDYSQDGRLTVSAKLPDLDCAAEMTMNRAAGMSREQMQVWKSRIESGLADPEVPADPEVRADPEVPADRGLPVESAPATTKADDQDRPVKQVPLEEVPDFAAQAQAVGKTAAKKPAKKLLRKKPKPQAAPKTDSRSKSDSEKIEINLGNDSTAESKSADPALNEFLRSAVDTDSKPAAPEIQIDTSQPKRTKKKRLKKKSGEKGNG